MGVKARPCSRVLLAGVGGR